jgi:hypothetical protein
MLLPPLLLLLPLPLLLLLREPHWQTDRRNLMVGNSRYP